MKKRLRLLLPLAAGVLGLAFAAPALAVYQPYLAVQQQNYRVGLATNVGFVFAADPSNDATAKMNIFSPAGYTSKATTFSPGTAIGRAYALVKAGALGGAILPLSGPVVVGNPADAKLLAAYAQCKGPTDPATPQAVWVLNTSLQGQAIQVPDFVNTSGAYTTQEICLPPPATAQFQAQVILANFTINGVFGNAAAAGQYQWVGDFTPYTGTVPNAAGTVEFRTFVGLPSSLTFKRVRSKRRFVKFAGKIAIGGLNIGGIRLRLYYGAKTNPAPNYLNPSLDGLIGRGKNVRAAGAKSSGSYSITRPRPKKRTYYQMRLDDEYVLTGGCLGPSPSGLPIPCLGEVIAPMTANQIKVVPRRR